MVVKNRGKWPALLVTVFAAIALYLCLYMFFLPTNVIVAREDIEEGSIISKTQVEVKKVARKDCSPGVMRTMEEVVGKEAAAPIFSGQQIIDRQLGAGRKKSILGRNDTILTLTSQQAFWSNSLEVGEKVRIVAVYPAENEVREETVGEIVKPAGGSIIRNMKRLQEAQSVTPAQTEISILTDVEGAKRVLLALKKSQLVYILPAGGE